MAVRVSEANAGHVLALLARSGLPPKKDDGPSGELVSVFRIGDPLSVGRDFGELKRSHSRHATRDGWNSSSDP